MAQSKPKKRTEKVYRSISEFKEHFFPNSHEKELAHKRSHNLQNFGTGLVQELLEGVRRKFRS